MKKYFLPLVVLVFIYTLTLCSQELAIHHINVGQADATLIISPTGSKTLIDGGNTGNGTNIIIPYLSSLGITSLNYVICSHYHADHLGGLDEIINGLGAANIGAVYDRGSDAPLPTTVAFTDYVTAANSTSRRYAVALGQIIDLGGGVTMQCVATDGEVINYGIVAGATGSENDLSIGWKLIYNSFQYFTGGDLGGESSAYADNETPLAPQVGDVDAFKINHHGSLYSTNQVFVNTLQAEAGIISVGTNTYGHPTQLVIDRLATANCYMYQTATGSGGTISAGDGVVANNHVILRTSGTSYTVSYGTTTNNYPGDGGSSDITPPVISAVNSSSVATSSAIITWTTDEPASSVVEYGLTTSYGSSTTGASGVTSHTVSLSGLSANSVYHYRVISADAAGNTATSTDHSFQTGGTFSYVPSGTAILVGTLSTGTYSNLATNNASYYVVNSTITGTRKTDWYGNKTITQAPSSVSKLTITYDGKNSRTVTQSLHLYNWTTSIWTQIDSRSVGSTDVTITNIQTSPANYISSTGEIRLRVLSTGTTKNFTCSGDFMQFTVETAGTTLSKNSPITKLETMPSQFSLHQNYPNPFNPATTIRYELMEEALVTVMVYDMLGREVTSLVNKERQQSGIYDVHFDASSLSSGVYHYRLIAQPLAGSTFVDTRKFMLVK
jgi:beta-lactamase superfamily II metal-dependent hydrolase